MRLFFLCLFFPLLALGQASQPASLPQTMSTSLPALTMKAPLKPTKPPKSPQRALALSLSISAVSYATLAAGGGFLKIGLTRGVAFGMLGLAGGVVGPGAGKIYLAKGGGKLFLTTVLRFAASTAVVSGFLLAQENFGDCSLSTCGLLWGSTAAFVGLGVYDIVTTNRAPHP